MLYDKRRHICVYLYVHVRICHSAGARQGAYAFAYVSSPANVRKFLCKHLYVCLYAQDCVILSCKYVRKRVFECVSKCATVCRVRICNCLCKSLRVCNCVVECDFVCHFM